MHTKSPLRTAARRLVELWGHWALMTVIIGAAAMLMGDWRAAGLFALIEIKLFRDRARIQYPNHPINGENGKILAMVAPVFVLCFCMPLYIPIDGTENSRRLIIGNALILLLVAAAVAWTSERLHDWRRNRKLRWSSGRSLNRSEWQERAVDVLLPIGIAATGWAARHTITHNLL